MFLFSFYWSPLREMLSMNIVCLSPGRGLRASVGTSTTSRDYVTGRPARWPTASTPPSGRRKVKVKGQRLRFRWRCGQPFYIIYVLFILWLKTVIYRIHKLLDHLHEKRLNNQMNSFYQCMFMNFTSKLNSDCQLQT